MGWKSWTFTPLISGKSRLRRPEPAFGSSTYFRTKMSTIFCSNDHLPETMTGDFTGNRTEF